MYTIACYKCMNGCVALILRLCVMYVCGVIIGRPTTIACIHCSPRRRVNVGRTICPFLLLCCLIKVIKQIICYKFGTSPERGQSQNASRGGTPSLRVSRYAPRFCPPFSASGRSFCPPKFDLVYHFIQILLGPISKSPIFSM